MNSAKLGPNGLYHTRLLQPPDLAALQSLFERGSDYFEIATGAPPAKDEATRAYVAGPPTKSVDDKRVIGVFDAADHLVGVLDAIVDWPQDGVWSMGILLLDPEHRGSGLGKAVLGAFEDWAKGRGAREFRTAVVTHHDAGRRFLSESGYHHEQSVADDPAGASQASILFFTKAA